MRGSRHHHHLPGHAPGAGPFREDAAGARRVGRSRRPPREVARRLAKQHPEEPVLVAGVTRPYGNTYLADGSEYNWRLRYRHP